MKYIICSICKNKKQTRHNRYKEILCEYYNNDKEQLKKLYVCRDCKYEKAFKLVKSKLPKISNIDITDNIKDTIDYKQIYNIIQEKTDILHKRGICIKTNRENYYYEIKAILKKINVDNFLINVYNNRIISITLKKLPFISEYNITIK